MRAIALLVTVASVSCSGPDPLEPIGTTMPYTSSAGTDATATATATATGSWRYLINNTEPTRH
jgi:hypothetical protein